MRDELPKIFAGRNAIVVYATTEPSEALLFGGKTATLHEGRITQFGPTAEVYRRPSNVLTAQVFSDPPINIAKVVKRGGEIALSDAITWKASKTAAAIADGEYTLGIRPHHISPVAQGKNAVEVEGRVLVTELSGSESVIHFDLNGQTWVSQSHGIHPFKVGSKARLHVDTGQGLYFDSAGGLIS
jgi:glycerol transport system ATP-binding protein